MKNLLTVDVEDWHQLAYRRVTGHLPPASESPHRQTDLLLRILSEHNTRATFFVLGIFAERFPAIVKAIKAAGHEVASHGFGHLIVNSMTPAEFREDTHRSKSLLEDLVGAPVLGYRAAEFSIRRASLWALEILAELRFAYDSSIFPIHHRRYGISDFAPQPVRYRLGDGRDIVEIPPAIISFGSLRLPVAGGGYFRLMPSWMIRCIFRRVNREQRPVVSYFHPYELDSERLDLFDAGPAGNWKQRLRGWQFNLHQNFRRASVASKLARTLSAFSFTTCEEYLRDIPVPEGRTLLPSQG